MTNDPIQASRSVLKSSNQYLSDKRKKEVLRRLFAKLDRGGITIGSKTAYLAGPKIRPWYIYIYIETLIWLKSRSLDPMWKINSGVHAKSEGCFVELRRDRIELSNPIWPNRCCIFKNRPLRREIFKNPGFVLTKNNAQSTSLSDSPACRSLRRPLPCTAGSSQFGENDHVGCSGHYGFIYSRWSKN